MAVDSQGKGTWIPSTAICFLLASSQHSKIGTTRLFVTNRHFFEEVETRRQYNILSEEFVVKVPGKTDAPVGIREFVFNQEYKEHHSKRGDYDVALFQVEDGYDDHFPGGGLEIRKTVPKPFLKANVMSFRALPADKPVEIRGFLSQDFVLDIEILLGDSGGPVVDDSEKVIGIVAQKIAGGRGLALCVSPLLQRLDEQRALEQTEVPPV